MKSIITSFHPIHFLKESDRIRGDEDETTSDEKGEDEVTSEEDGEDKHEDETTLEEDGEDKHEDETTSEEETLEEEGKDEEEDESELECYAGSCILCGELISFKSNYYYCFTCDFHFHEDCATNLMKSSLTINRPKTHEHTLTFIRQKNAFKCVACGEVNEQKMNMYGCLICNFIIHKNCIDLPKVIKITRHSHRLFHTLQLTNDGSMTCRVCYQDLVYGYGGYICTNKLCEYKVHSYCATNMNVWDGKDLEGEDEEISTSIDVESSSLLEEVNGNHIRHFIHHHDLVRLSTSIEDEQEGGWICHACNRPIEFGYLLGCKQCNDFALHDTCASLPWKLEHAFHQHPLTLHIDMMTIEERFFTCSICERESNGFMYRCSQEECKFKMDAKCASFEEPFKHIAHQQHPLYISHHISYDMNLMTICEFCSDEITTGVICPECRNFCLDIKCATIPQLVRCNYGNHPLTISNRYLGLLLCDICEEEINYFMTFYGCSYCNIAQHIHCVIGRYMHLKPGHAIKVNGFEIEIASNRHLTRPICSTCHNICRDKVIFINHKDGATFCSIKCISSSSKKAIA